MPLALLVIDMQCQFDAEIQNILGNVVSVIQACNQKNIPVFVTQHGDETSGVLYNWWNRVPLFKGTDGWRLVPEIAATVDEGRSTVIEKMR